MWCPSPTTKNREATGKRFLSRFKTGSAHGPIHKIWCTDAPFFVICYVLTLAICSILFNLVCHVTCSMTTLWLYTCATRILQIYIYITSFHPVDFQKRCEHTVSIIFMWHVRIRAVQDDAHLNQGLFRSYVRTFFQPRLFLHVLLSGGVLDCLPYRYAMFFLSFIVQLVSTFLQVVGSNLWAMFVRQQTKRLTQFKHSIYIYVMHTSWGQ